VGVSIAVGGWRLSQWGLHQGHAGLARLRLKCDGIPLRESELRPPIGGIKIQLEEVITNRGEGCRDRTNKDRFRPC
jgi:hypothetical protein